MSFMIIVFWVKIEFLNYLKTEIFVEVNISGLNLVTFQIPLYLTTHKNIIPRLINGF